jgi:hypothetical protein
MVTVPFFCPDVPAMTKNPVFMYYADRFEKPAPFEPDIVVAARCGDDRLTEASRCVPRQENYGRGKTGARADPETT